jgi:hypothetical protein
MQNGANFGIRTLVGVDDQFFFREELERAITLHIDRIPEISLSGRKNGYDDPLFVIVGRLLNSLAYRKFGHREPLSESSGAIINPNWLTHLKQRGPACRPLRPWHPGSKTARLGQKEKRAWDGLQGQAALSCLILVNDPPV